MLDCYATIQGQARVHVGTDSSNADSAYTTYAILLLHIERNGGERQVYSNRSTMDGI